MISLYDVLEASNGQLFGEARTQLFTDFCFDARRAGESQLYVALKTERGDGHQFMQEAVAKGVTGLLCVTPPTFDTDDLTVVLVRDAEVAVRAWAQFILRRLGTRLIGVTGTGGQSTTAAALKQVLGSRYTVHHRPGDYGGRLRLPYTLATLTAEQQLVILELDVSRPGEMSEMLQDLPVDVGIVMHSDHAATDQFGTPDRLRAEFERLVRQVGPGGRVVLNYDDDRVRELGRFAQSYVSTIGVERFGADLLAYNVVLGLTGTGFDLTFKQKRYVGRWTPWLGRHQIYSVLAALLVGMHYHIPLDDGMRALKTMEPLPGRMKPLRGVNGCLLIDDTYDADPFSTQMALEWLRTIKDDGYRTIFVLGDMTQTGEHSQRAHRRVGQSAARHTDVFITQGAAAALAGRAALDEGLPTSCVHITYSASDVIAQLQRSMTLSASDVILIKGGAAARMDLTVQPLLADKRDTDQLVRQDLPDDALGGAPPTQPSWVEVDLDALAYNVRGIKRLIGDDVTLLAVVKADAYGCGAVAVARTALHNGADYLGVATIDDALELRNAGIDAPILTLSYVPPGAIQQALRQNITVTLYDLELARIYDRIICESRATADDRLRVHVKIDTGLGRLGILPGQATTFFRHFANFTGFHLEGIYTHFAAADEDADFTQQQLTTFRRTVNELRSGEFTFRYTHAANSAGMLLSPDTHFNMVRPGLALYGLSPSTTVRVPDDFRPVLSWKTVVTQVKTLPPGHSVGYGRTYRTRGEERIAVLPVGYADGLRRAPSNWGYVLIHGQPAPLVGRVSMEKATVNVTHIPGVRIGDEVVLLGRQGSATITADEIAAQLGTVSYEVLTTIIPRARRR